MLKMSGSIGEMGIQLLIGFLILVVGANIIFAILFCIVLAKMVSADARATTGWREFCSACKERLNIVINLVNLYQPHEKSKEEEELVRKVIQAVHSTGLLHASCDAYIEPSKTLKFQSAESELGRLIVKLVGASDVLPHLLRKHEYIVARSALDTCEERLESKLKHYNYIAQTCNKLKNSFPGPMVASMMRFGDKAVIKKDLTVAREKFDPKLATTSTEPEASSSSDSPKPN